MHYLVAGTGYTGRRVLERLPGGSAIGLNRSSADLAGAELRLVDLDGEDDAPIELPAPFVLLYTVPPPATGRHDPRLERLLLRLEPKPERLVYLSTSGVYGDRGGARVTEIDAPKPETARAVRRLAAEEQVRAWAGTHGVDWVILRVPGIYGPGRLGLDRLEAGAEVLGEPDAGPGNRIHVDDLVRCCLAAMRTDTPGGVFNVGDGDYRSTGDFVRTTARLAGLPAPREISLAEARERWSAMRLSFVAESRRVDTSKMRRVLGVSPTYADPEDGIRASLPAED